MVRFLLSLLLLALCVSAAEAGPFRKATRSVATTQATACIGGQCGVPESTASVRQRTVTVARGGGAQAHAEAMATSGRQWHTFESGVYEGVGSGGSPQAALSSCCNNGGAVIEEGVAFGHGRWFACRRYSLR